MTKMRSISVALSLTMAISANAYAGDKFRCEAKEGGEELKDVKNRKDCNAKGGKWIKAEGHDHAPGEGAHDHNEESSKKEKKK